MKKKQYKSIDEIMNNMIRFLCIALSLSVGYASCSVRPEHKDNKYGTAGGCARDEWQNKVSCESYPMSIYCKWSEDHVSEKQSTFILSHENSDEEN